MLKKNDKEGVVLKLDSYIFSEIMKIFKAYLSKE